MGKTKDFAISFIRLLAMLFIITCHFLQYYNNVLAWWFNVGVQIFLCISGFLYGQKTIKDGLKYIANNFVKILVDYYVLIFIGAFFYKIFHPELVTKTIFFSMLFCRTTIQGLGHLWFIPNILFCYLCTPLLYEFVNRIEHKSDNQYLLNFILMLIIFHFIIEKHLQIILASAIICYTIGFFLGRLKIHPRKYNLKNAMFLFLVISIVMNGIQIYFNNTIIASINTKSIWYNDFCSYAHVSLGISIFLVLYILLGYINFGKFKIILSLSDQYSYEIYLVHQIFILGPFCLEKFTSYIVINIILICIVILALSALLKKISAPIKKRIIKQL